MKLDVLSNSILSCARSVPDSFLEQLHRAFGDRRSEVMLDVVRDPFRNARSAQRLELERGRAGEQPLVRL